MMLVTQEAWELFQSWHGRPLPPGGDCAMVAVSGAPAAATLLFATSGPYLFCEHLAVNPELPPRVRHTAVTLLAQAVRDHGAILGKVPFALVHHQGIARTLARAGWRRDVTGAWFAT